MLDLFPLAGLMRVPLLRGTLYTLNLSTQYGSRFRKSAAPLVRCMMVADVARGLRSSLLKGWGAQLSAVVGICNQHAVHVLQRSPRSEMHHGLEQSKRRDHFTLAS